MENVYGNLKMMRVKFKFSMAEMAEKLDINQSSYFQLEKGETKLTIERLYEIAGIFKVSVLDLLGEESKLSDSTEIETLRNENKILKEKSEKLDNVEATFLSIFQDHFKQVEQDIDNRKFEGLFDGKLYDGEITDNEKFNLISFIVFIQETEWYEISMKLGILTEQKIKYAWDRYEYINPFSLRIDDIPKFKASNPNSLNLSDNEIIIEIVKQRGSSKRYLYLDSEVECMLEIYNTITEKNVFKRSKSLSTSHSFIGKSIQVKINEMNDLLENESIED